MSEDYAEYETVPTLQPGATPFAGMGLPRPFPYVGGRVAPAAARVSLYKADRGYVVRWCGTRTLTDEEKACVPEAMRQFVAQQAMLTPSMEERVAIGLDAALEAVAQGMKSVGPASLGYQGVMSPDDPVFSCRTQVSVVSVGERGFLVRTKIARESEKDDEEGDASEERASGWKDSAEKAIGRAVAMLLHSAPRSFEERVYAFLTDEEVLTFLRATL